MGSGQYSPCGRIDHGQEQTRPEIHWQANMERQGGRQRVCKLPANTITEPQKEDLWTSVRTAPSKHCHVTSNQCGFGTTDAIHAVQLLIEKQHSAFGLSGPGESVYHDLIGQGLRFHGAPEEQVSWDQLLYRNTTSVVRCPAGRSPAFDITVGIHQRSALSPLLFILCMDMWRPKDHIPGHPSMLMISL